MDPARRVACLYDIQPRRSCIAGLQQVGEQHVEQVSQHVPLHPQQPLIGVLTSYIVMPGTHLRAGCLSTIKYPLFCLLTACITALVFKLLNYT